MTLVTHPSLKKVFKECDRWLEHARGKESLPIRYLTELEEKITVEGNLSPTAGLRCEYLGNYYGVLTCAIFGEGAFDDISQPLRWAVAFRSLAFRFVAAVPAKSETNLPLPFWTSMQAAGPAMLSLWDEARSCAHWLIDVAHRDQAVIPEKWRKAGWGKGTNDAFLIGLFSQAFDLPTHYRPVLPLIPEYQALLDRWRTQGRAAFQQAMQSAAEFHISRSKHSTEKNTYEFDSFMDRVFPAELLAVQALRRRDGLPEFETGHALVDAPWAVIRDLPEAEPHPLAVAVETRLKHDYPRFR